MPFIGLYTPPPPRPGHGIETPFSEKLGTSAGSASTPCAATPRMGRKDSGGKKDGTKGEMRNNSGGWSRMGTIKRKF